MINDIYLGYTQGLLDSNSSRQLHLEQEGNVFHKPMENAYKVFADGRGRKLELGIKVEDIDDEQTRDHKLGYNLVVAEYFMSFSDTMREAEEDAKRYENIKNQINAIYPDLVLPAEQRLSFYITSFGAFNIKENILREKVDIVSFFVGWRNGSKRDEKSLYVGTGRSYAHDLRQCYANMREGKNYYVLPASLGNSNIAPEDAYLSMAQRLERKLPGLVKQSIPNDNTLGSVFNIDRELSEELPMGIDVSTMIEG